MRERFLGLTAAGFVQQIEFDRDEDEDCLCERVRREICH